MVTNANAPATVDEAYTGTNVQVRVGGGGWVPNGTNIDPLTHATNHTFGARVNGSGGWSDEGTCRATTLTLGVQITAVSSTTRSVSANMATEYGNASSLTLENVRTDNNVTGSTWDPLTHGTTFTVTATNSDGYNTVTATSPISTATLATPVISIWSVTTRGANTSASCTNGSSCTSSIDGGAASRNDLSDGTYHGVTANNTDGYNNVGSSSGFTTATLAPPAAPTCNAWSDAAYLDTTVRWSSNGSLSRSSVWATSAGYYSATATATISDGYNSNSSSNSCGISVAAPPPPSMSAGCASGTVSASPTPGVSWVFLNLCDATTTAILQSVYTAEFEGRSYNNVGIPGIWVDAKYTSYQGRMSVTNSIVSSVEIRVRLTDDWGRVSPWYTVTKTV